MRKYLVALFILLVILAPFSIVTANGGQGDGGSGSASSGGDSGGGDDSGGRGDSGSSSSGSDDSGPEDSGKNGSGKDDSGRGNEAEVTATGTVTPDETQTTGPAETKDGENDDTGKGDVTNIQVKIKEETSKKHTDVTVLKVKITEREAEIEQELHVAGVKDQEILQNQSSILVGVQALREVNELVSVNAANITRIETQLRQSLMNTTQAEVRIKERNQIIRFFIGGDDRAARQILGDLDQNQDRIREMEQLVAQCNCSQDVQDVLRDRLRNMTREQDRLQTLAQEEINDTGFLGVLWKGLPFSPIPAGS
jgi:uncharacterized protein with FMN-binding domain